MAKKKYFWLMFGVLVLLLVFFRSYQLYEHTIFLSDQGRDAIIMKRIVTFEHFPAIGAPSSVGQVYLGPFYYYAMAPFLWLFGYDPIGPSVGVAALSVAGIISAFLIIKKELSRTTALLFLGVVTFSATLTEYSRFSWNPNLLPYFSFVTLYFFHRWYKKSTFRDGALFGLCFGLSIQLHYLAVLLSLPMLAFVAMKLYQKNFHQNSFFSLITAFVAFVVSISPLVIFDLRHQYLNTKQLFKLFSEGGLSSGEPYFSRLWDTAFSLISHTFALENTSRMPLIAIAGALVALTIVSYRKSKNSFHLLHIISSIGYIGGFALLGGERYPHYFGPVFLSLYLCIAELVGISRKNVKLYPLIAVVIAMYMYTNTAHMTFLFQQGNNQIKEAQSVAALLDKHIDDQPFNFATIPDDLGEERFLYFLELEGKIPAERAKLEITDQLYVLCGNEPCGVLSSPSWNITMFGEAMVIDQWSNLNGVGLYKLVHTKKEQR